MDVFLYLLPFFLWKLWTELDPDGESPDEALQTSVSLCYGVETSASIYDFKNSVRGVTMRQTEHDSI